MFLRNSNFNMSILGCDLQFRVQQMWFRNLFPWHIILHLFTFKLKDLVSPENMKVSLQTSTQSHWWKCWMKLSLTWFMENLLVIFFHPESKLASPFLTSFQTRKNQLFLLQLIFVTEFYIENFSNSKYIVTILSLLSVYSSKPPQITAGFLGMISYFRILSDSTLCLSTFSLFQWL